MMNMDLMDLVYKAIIGFVPFLLALSFHEYAHGLVAHWRGDNTAKQMGRLTMNPLAHADPVGTFLLPMLAIFFSSPFFFGWAKPVPVNERNLKRPRKDMFWIALAGPASNILLAFVGVVLLALALVYFRTPGAGASYFALLSAFLQINLFLAFFNLIPIHPLDGGKIVEPFLPAQWNMWLENNQSSLNMFLLIFILVGGRILSAPVKAVYGSMIDMSESLAHIIM